MPPKARPELDRFAEKIALTDSGCLVWLASTNGVGYGAMNVRVSVGKGMRVLAHRWSYEHHFGPIPSGLQIDHLCRNRLCVNPAHLEATTQRVNILRGTSPTAVNSAKECCVNGHAFTPENTYVSPRRGRRECRECHRIREVARYGSGRKFVRNRYPSAFTQGASTYVIGTADTDVALNLAGITPETHSWGGTFLGAFVRRRGLWVKASDDRPPKGARPGVCFMGPIRAKEEH